MGHILQSAMKMASIVCISLKFLQKVAKNSQCLQKLTNLDANKRCQMNRKDVNYQLVYGLFSNILLLMNSRRSKMSSLHTYGVS